jgi:hypothetical protein
VPNRKGGFAGRLLEPPKPLPDDEPSTAKQPVELVPDPTEEVQTPKRASVAKTVAAPEQAQEAGAQTMAAVPPAPKAVDDGQAGKRRAATSIRIQQSVADDLESAWLRARTTVDPRLSYTEFVSRLLRRALQEESQGV